MTTGSRITDGEENVDASGRSPGVMGVCAFLALFSPVFISLCHIRTLELSGKRDNSTQFIRKMFPVTFGNVCVAVVPIFIKNMTELHPFGSLHGHQCFKPS